MKPYNSSESKKEEVRTMFDAIAFRYDLLNSLLSLGIHRSWRRRVVKQVKKRSPKRLLDMATGTADLAIALAGAMPQAEISGVDLSENMLALGRVKVERKGLAQRIHLRQGDAEHLSDPQGTYDAVTVGFGVRNFEDIPLGISEMFRVLKPGGELYVLEFGTPRNRCFGAFYRFYFHHILPTVGALLSKDKRAYTYLPHSVDAFPERDAFLEILNRAGFTEASFQNLFGGVAQIYRARK